MLAAGNFFADCTSLASCDVVTVADGGSATVVACWHFCCSFY